MPCYCGHVKNVTVSVPEDVYRTARIRAAERGTSISGLVAGYLRSLSTGNEQRRIQGEIKRFRATDRISRDELHDRALR